MVDVYFFELCFNEIFAVLLEISVLAAISKVFSNNCLFVIYAILGSGMFQYRPTFVIHDFANKASI